MNSVTASEQELQDHRNRLAANPVVVRAKETMPVVKLVLEGNIQSKKNNLRPRAKGKGSGKGYMYDPAARHALDMLTLQARCQWGARAPLESPRLEITFMVGSRRQDRDNMLVVVLDCLKSAGVLVDDNIAHCNGTLVVHPAIVTDARFARTEIEIS